MHTYYRNKHIGAVNRNMKGYVSLLLCVLKISASSVTFLIKVSIWKSYGTLKNNLFVEKFLSSIKKDQISKASQMSCYMLL